VYTDVQAARKNPQQVSGGIGNAELLGAWPAILRLPQKSPQPAKPFTKTSNLH